MAVKGSAFTKAAAVGVAVLVVLAIVGAATAYRQVPEGHQGVEKEWGAVSGNTLESGAHWKVPVMESVQAVEVRPRTYTMSATEGEGEKARGDAIDVKTVNGSTVGVDLTVRYRIKADEADSFVEDWNDETQMEQRLIRPTIRTVLRDEASSLQTTGDDAIYTQQGREALETAALEALGSEFEDEPVVLEAVQIRNIDLPEQIDQALDEKERAKQQVEVEKEKVKQEEAKKEQEIVRAEADAEAIDIRGQALDNNPIVLEQQYIEALENGNTIYVPMGEDGGVTLTRETGNGSATNSTNSTSTNSTATVLP
ncbi:prohibitin family protein [Halorubellus sp. PRR65]|uniref:prohibitin family protein n=1 Tax=Halorubellus sp. PRR65 TaxID=3098148 RepID=UPI002B25B240|nr:prohibitin family protein [Halorubellus sp. PRR65]